MSVRYLFGCILFSLLLVGCFESDEEEVDKYVQKMLNGETFNVQEVGLSKEQQIELVKRYMVESTNQDLMRIAKEINEITPAGFTKDTNLTGVMSGNMELVYIINYLYPKSHYREFDTSQTTIRAIEDFKRNTLKEGCNINKNQLELKVKIIYELYDSNDEQLGEFVITRQDCGY